MESPDIMDGVGEHAACFLALSLSELAGVQSGTESEREPAVGILALTLSESAVRILSSGSESV